MGWGNQMDTNMRVILLVALSLAASFVIAVVPILSPVWVLLTIWVSHRLLLTPGKAKRDGGGRQDANFWRMRRLVSSPPLCSY